MQSCCKTLTTLVAATIGRHAKLSQNTDNTSRCHYEQTCKAVANCKTQSVLQSSTNPNHTRMHLLVAESIGRRYFVKWPPPGVGVESPPSATEMACNIYISPGTITYCRRPLTAAATPDGCTHFWQPSVAMADAKSCRQHVNIPTVANVLKISHAFHDFIAGSRHFLLLTSIRM